MNMQSESLISRPAGLVLSSYDILLNRLLSMEMRPGDRLAVDKLAREFGISQTPVREALSRLEAQRLVVKTHLVGYSVAPNLTNKEYEDLYEMRRIIEPAAAAKAASVASKESLEKLSAHTESMTELSASKGRDAYNKFARGDIDFHTLVAKGSGNRFLEETVSSSSLQLHLFRRGYHVPWVAAIASEHEAILKAISDRDPERAGAAMILHLDNSYQRHRETLLDY